MFNVLLIVYLTTFDWVNPASVPQRNEKLSAYPKCCAINEYLVEISDGSFACKFIGQQNQQVTFDSIHFIEECYNNECIDYLHAENNDELKLVSIANCTARTTIESYDYFPKCCPVGKVYNSANKKCIPTNNSYDNSNNIFKYGMMKCPYDKYAIKDYVWNSNLQIVDGKFCIDWDSESGKKMVRICERIEDVCLPLNPNGIRCIRKCCPDGSTVLARSCAVNFAQGISIDESYILSSRFKVDDEFAIIQGTPQTKHLPLKSQEYFIDPDGIFHLDGEPSGLDRPKYCLDNFQIRPVHDMQQALFLYPDADALETPKIKVISNVSMLIASCIFLLLTILCYVIMNELKNIFAKSILVYCTVMLLLFIDLSVAKLFPNMETYSCIFLGFLTQFLAGATFTWMNIICFDMWMTFGTIRKISIKNRGGSLKKFLFYNLYAFGVPSIITLITFLTFKYEFLPEHLTPDLGKDSCALKRKEGRYDLLLYSNLPIALFIIANCVMFLKTTIYYFNVKGEIQRMRDEDTIKRKQRFQADKEKLLLLIKLFLIMGISWLFEILSDVISFKQNKPMQIIEIILDCFNSLQGVSIFCVFILKKNVLLVLRKKLWPSIVVKKSKSEMTSSTLLSANSDVKLNDCTRA